MSAEAMAMPRGNGDGNAATVADLTRARARARARVSPVAMPVNPPAEVVEETADRGAVDWSAKAAPWLADLRNAVTWSSTPMPLGDLARLDLRAAIPGDHPGLRVAYEVYRWAVAVPVTAVLHALAWLCQHPLRLVPAVVVAVAVLALWI